MVEIICKRSGLKFEAENRRKSVHPKISWYTTHRDYSIRYPAVAVIERGKQEGWDTLEKFEAEIQKALNPEPQPRPEYDFEGAWVAQITGSHSTYRFDRTFLEAIDSEGGFKRYNIKASGDGIYETCYKSAKGNETQHYYRVESGSLTEIELAEVEALFPEDEIAPQVSIEACISTERYLGKAGEIVEHEGKVYEIIRVDESSKTVSEWDDFEDEHRSWKEPVYKSWLKEASAEVSETFLKAKAQTELESATKKIAIARLKEISSTITIENGSVAPEFAPYPTGKTFVVQQGHYQANHLLVLEDNRLWYLIYNGRDGDLWDLNNVENGYIGRWLEVSPELKAEIEELLNKC
jgi:hypothetical protein